jgi:3-oxoacyl-[acyl-carrier-protein] synthase II
LAFATTDMTYHNAGLKTGSVAPERLGVVFGADLIYTDLEEMRSTYQGCLVEGRFEFNRWGPVALAELYPLWLLKYLPNMPACHIGIAHDARGPNNSLLQGEVSSLAAIIEAKRVIERGLADVILAGGTSASRLHPTVLCFRGEAHQSHRNADPAAASRPFDADRDGMVNGEGAAAFVLESRQHALARGAAILARILGGASRFEPVRDGQLLRGTAIRNAALAAIAQAQLQPGDIGHVNANGLGTIEHDRVEARVIREALGDVPVFAAKSFFGNLGAGAGAVEMAASVLALGSGLIPPTMNYARRDPECPIEVVHSAPRASHKPTALVQNFTVRGQAAAIVLAGEA